MRIHIAFLQAYLLLLVTMLISGCTVSHEYGPYSGRILDLETSKPIEGAVVFLRFYTRFQLSPGGPVDKYADAIEVVTDHNGEFSIPVHKVQAFRFFHGWELDCTVKIFKPGYGVFPHHKKVKPRFSPTWSIPEDQYIVVWLPKLKTKEDREKNLSNVGYSWWDVPNEKQRIYFQMYNAEKQALGFPPSIKTN